MRKRKPEIPDDIREWFREQGRKGGKIGGPIGGKASLKTMTKAERVARARNAANARAEQRRPLIEQRVKQVAKLRADGKSMIEVAAALGIAASTAYKLAQKRKAIK